MPQLQQVPGGQITTQLVIKTNTTVSNGRNMTVKQYKGRLFSSQRQQIVGVALAATGAAALQHLGQLLQGSLVATQRGDSQRQETLNRVLRLAHTAREQFVRMQAAWDACDTVALQGLTTPQITDLATAWREGMDVPARVALADALWRSDVFEAKIAAAKLLTPS